MRCKLITSKMLFILYGQGVLQMGIDRYELVKRHNPVLKDFDLSSPLSVGNGEFAFTVDATGLQTFPRVYGDATPLCTAIPMGMAFISSI